VNPAEYLEVVKTRLITDAVVVSVEIRRERSTLADAHLRARLELIDGSTLEFSEYIQRQPDGEIEVVTYSYHWSDSQGDLIRRWDNTPHFPGLPGFPHHIHEGSSDTVVPGEPIDIFAVLDRIASILR
jgi:hypothetical protein